VVLLVLGKAVMRIRDQGCHIGGVRVKRPLGRLTLATLYADMNELVAAAREQAWSNVMAKHSADEAICANASAFDVVKLQVRDDRELWWSDLQVAWLVHAMDGSAAVAGSVRDQLLKQWPQLDPELWVIGTRTTINHLRFKQCPHCAVWFIGHHARRFCSADCHANSKRQRNTEQTRQRRAKWRQWRRDNPHNCERPTNCEHCDRELTPDRKTRRFCSDRCRKAAARQRKAQATS
jgi:hypothetical protein